ncbi:MAG TPA: GNAT family N-acetyltransferase [Methylocystis sp.]|nr:GNAT family N-acetyltransferase [Methylocystis sp.]
MTLPTRSIAVDGLVVSIRPQRPEDATFLYALFRANALRDLERAGLPQALLDNLIDLQHRSRGDTYRGLYPQAEWSILDVSDEPIGELVENDEGRCVYVVDLTLLPAWQARGVGPAVMRAIMADSAALGKDVRANVLFTNEPCLKMCARLGFVASPPDESAHMALRWTAESTAESQAPG